MEATQQKLEIVTWNAVPKPDFGGKIWNYLELVVRFDGAEYTLCSRIVENTLRRALYGNGWNTLDLVVKDWPPMGDHSAAARAKGQQNLRVQDAFKEESAIQLVCAYLLAHEQALCANFNFPTLAQKNQQELAEKQRLVEAEAAFAQAGPNDLVNSGYGYFVKKKNYARAQRLGFDGVDYDL